MKKLIALFLSLVMLCALAVPAFAAEAAPLDPVTAHGGVPGQINVMVNGKCITFPDAVPEMSHGRTMVPLRAVMKALDAKVVYNGDDDISCTAGGYKYTFAVGSNIVTVRPTEDNNADVPQPEDIVMNCAPYIKGDRTYVPIRFISEALGYNVGWDNENQTAIVTDLNALAEKIDQDFTIFNKYMATRPDVASSQQSTGNLKATITLMDSMNGNQTKTLTGSYDGIISPDGMSMKMKYDFSSLWDLIAAYIAVPPVEGELSEQYAQQVELLKGMLAGNWEIRADMKSEIYYYAMPVLNSFLQMQGVDIADNAWISVDMGAFMKEMEEAGVVEAEAVPSVSTIGELFSYTLSSNGVDDINAYDAVLEVAGVLAELVGDKKFTTSGSTHTLTLTKEDLVALTGDADIDGLSWDMLSEFSLTVKLADNGDTDVDLQCAIALADGSDMVQLSLKANQKGGKSSATMECHVKNTVKVTVETTQTTTATNKAPEVTPPKGATVVDMNELNGGTITSPDGP